MTIAFLCVVSFLIFLQYKKEKNPINLISVLMAPYLVIVLFNNFFFYKLGFYKISDNTLAMILLAFVVFFLGVRFAGKTRKYVYYQELESVDVLDNYNIKRIKTTLAFIAVLGIGKLLYAIVTGLINTEGYMGEGVVGHLILLSYSLVPIIFLYWTYNTKKISYLIITMMIILVSFSSFIKYNVISMIIVLFLYTTMVRKSLIKKGVIFLVAFVMLFFIANYAIGFFMQQVDVETSFYSNHFWAYCSGSLINANNRYAGLHTETVGILYKLMVYLTALPNMFLYPFGVRVFSWEALDFSFYRISENGQFSNVTDAISRLFPANCDSLEIVITFFMIFIIAFIFMRLYLKWKSKTLSTTLPIFLTFFVFLSFFGTFYMNSGPWEALVWSFITPMFFRKKSSHLNNRYNN